MQFAQRLVHSLVYCTSRKVFTLVLSFPSCYRSLLSEKEFCCMDHPFSRPGPRPLPLFRRAFSRSAWFLWQGSTHLRLLLIASLLTSFVIGSWFGLFPAANSPPMAMAATSILLGSM